MSASRLRFRAIFALQYARLVFGMCPHFVHPCQKQPSTKTATRLCGKKKSGTPGMLCWRNFQPPIPRRTRIALKRISVVLLPADRMARMLSLLARLTRFFTLGICS
jgi:hypothetical protein